ncbi:MAG: ParB N-terminal domain-containing protein [Pseudomonadota bacterium]
MAKRKRLTPAQADYLSANPAGASSQICSDTPTGALRGPISQVSGDAAAHAALDELAGEIRQARDSGRLIQEISLDEIDMEYLVRDRVVADDQEMTALMQSIATRGQQHPIEVVQLAADRYGLISGWRRVTALKRLRATGTDGFETALAILRQPDTAADAYLSMVEENEIRVGLSYYERARIAAKAVEQGVYETEKAALLSLFRNASRAKRSKIRSFLPIYHTLDDALSFAGAIPERLGLRLSAALEEHAQFAETLKTILSQTPPDSPEAEMALIDELLSPASRSPRTASATSAGGADASRAVTVQMKTPGTITLRGPGANAALLKKLKRWLDEN